MFKSNKLSQMMVMFLFFFLKLVRNTIISFLIQRKRKSNKETKLLMASFKAKLNAKMEISILVQNVCDHNQ